ncbi:MAG: hypothetical protein HND40_06780 [Ignavibacteriota bacterium]|jgi:YHS domain-containing protein|nr:hypothetical protein [Ignavibacteriota bacterium]MBV6420886.1 hypothetical protein [Ignavibacteriaceae bacterium]MCO6446842.1 hypothetical protein [Ignavibacterium album]MDT3696739.1 hypothetical protein [Ignavibacterium sp.]QQS37153.1 MAG: hypothetical protein IPM56_04150 [Ignavibacteriales bacterium]
MKQILALISILIVAAGLTFSQQNNTEVFSDEKVIEVNPLDRKITEPKNELCPVEGEEINSTITQLIYNNKIIGFCCEVCDEAFLKNPKAYEDKLNGKDA